MKKDVGLRLTSVKVLKELYAKFKTESTDKSFTFQKLVNRTLYLYDTNDEFRNMIENFTELKEKQSNKTL